MNVEFMTLDPMEGERRKLGAHALLEARRELVILRGRRALLTALQEHTRATADNVRDAVDLPDGINPVCLGAVPGQLARAGLIERVGFVESRRAETHGRPVSVWQTADGFGVAMWLESHPDRPDPAPAEVDGELCLFDFVGNATADAGTSAGHY